MSRRARRMIGLNAGGFNDPRRKFAVGQYPGTGLTIIQRDIQHLFAQPRTVSATGSENRPSALARWECLEDSGIEVSGPTPHDRGICRRRRTLHSRAGLDQRARIQRCRRLIADGLQHRPGQVSCHAASRRSPASQPLNPCNNPMVSFSLSGLATCGIWNPLSARSTRTAACHCGLSSQAQRHPPGRSQMDTVDTRRLINQTLGITRRDVCKYATQLPHLVSITLVIALIHAVENPTTISLQTAPSLRANASRSRPTLTLVPEQCFDFSPDAAP